MSKPDYFNKEERARIEQGKRDELVQSLDSLLENKNGDFVREKDLGQALCFKDAESALEKIIALSQQLRDCDLTNLPIPTLDMLLSMVNDAQRAFGEIRDFSPDKQQQNVIDERNRIVESIRNRHSNFFQNVAPVISYLYSQDKVITSAEIRIREVVESLEKQRNEATGLVEETNLALQKVRDLAAEAGVSQHAIYFKEAVEEFDNSSKWWLGATILIGIATAGWGLFTLFFHQISKDATTPQVLQATASKLIVFSALYYALIWSAKNYSAHRHNCVVNKHRQNALSTFEAFVKAAGDDQDTKNAVLLQATQSIFSAQSSGYVVKDAEADAPSKVIEIMRSSSTKS